MYIWSTMVPPDVARFKIQDRAKRACHVGVHTYCTTTVCICVRDLHFQSMTQYLAGLVPNEVQSGGAMCQSKIYSLGFIRYRPPAF